MIRCLIGNHLTPRYPCSIHRPDRRNKQIAQQVIARDRRCWKCGATDNLEAGHIIAKAQGGQDTMANMRAECRSLNRTGRCGKMKPHG